jgi:DHA1 family arabinose polymer transporter-like MFS transporter
MAPPGKVTAAVAGMIAGMTVANLVGVPAGTWLGHQFSWRYTFLGIAVQRGGADVDSLVGTDRL